ncbi:unnamed protein product [Brassica napus]|uniref:(rape) hypothetical protein n=1 Tax=Brassica napus TaxID=3708 RepID=A0A816SI96_BRANA|nr:unnamed protein product [Brassica napus]
MFFVGFFRNRSLEVLILKPRSTRSSSIYKSEGHLEELNHLVTVNQQDKSAME